MTDAYAIFGHPVAHSKSPYIHRQFAEQVGEDMSYTKQLVPEGGFDAAADAFFAAGGKGLNVTLPFKIDAYTYAARLTQRARRAGAVNTLAMQSEDRKSTRLNSSHVAISYAVFCLKKKNTFE